MASKQELEIQLMNAEFRNKFNSQTRNKTISLRISTETYEHLRIEAGARNQSVSDYLNNLILEDWIKLANQNYKDEVKSLDLFEK